MRTSWPPLLVSWHSSDMEESIPSWGGSVVLKLHIKFLCRPDLLAASQIVLKLALKLLFLLKQQSLPWSTDWSSTQEPSTQKQQVCQVGDARLAQNPNCLVHLTLIFQSNADFGNLRGRKVKSKTLGGRSAEVESMEGGWEELLGQVVGRLNIWILFNRMTISFIIEQMKWNSSFEVWALSLDLMDSIENLQKTLVEKHFWIYKWCDTTKVAANFHLNLLRNGFKLVFLNIYL